MMTSVTLPSASDPLSGGYSSSLSEGISTSESGFDVPRTVKRSFSITGGVGGGGGGGGGGGVGGGGGGESCKKRRKQSTPIRISNTESEVSPASNCLEGKLSMPSPELSHRCAICQLRFDDAEQLQSHIVCDHPPLECKKEPEDRSATPTPILSFMENQESVGYPLIRTEMQWMNEIQNKEWLNSNLPNLSFNANNPIFMTFPQFTQPENIPIKSIRIFNPDAFCELCNKEFCNKYFLKTHKANKHGIYTDNVSSEPIQTSVTVVPHSNNVKLTNTVPSVESTTTKSEVKNSVKAAAAANPFASIFLSKPSVINSLDGELSENVANSNGLSSSSESDKRYLDDQAAEYQSPTNTQTETTSVKNELEESFRDASATNKISPDHQSREMDLSYRLRRFGVMNPKAFCEICCKEYCNKYFLRTHKLKRHGIYIPDDKDKDHKTDGITNLSFPSNVQTSPLNLIMSEQSNNSDCKTTSPINISCDTCGIKFQNVGLSQLHNVNVHSKSANKEQAEDGEKSAAPADPQRVNEKVLNAEAINEDLQKLQTMILQLNDLENSKTVTACSVCNRDFENRFYLHAHMLSVHGMLLDNVGEGEKTTESDNTSNNNTVCDVCGKEVKSADEMTKHILEYHSNNQVLCADNIKEECNNSVEKVNNKISPAGHIPERRVSMNVTPTSSYCEICNKELCNKYFMKTHMQRMHGIEIENGAQIGGVVCDICNKELCSKYFLRVHKHNTHGIMEYGSNLFPSRKSDTGETSTPQPQFPAAPAPVAPTTIAPDPDPALKPGDLADLSHRYFTHFTEVCTICSRRFRSTKWLKAHLITDHGQAGAEKWNEIEQQLQNRNANKPPAAGGLSPSLRIPNSGQEQKEGVQQFISNIFGIDETNSRMYQCSSCSFTTPLLPLLFVHERSHTSEMERLTCPACPQTFIEKELLQRHLLSQHPYMLPCVIKDQESAANEIGKIGNFENGDENSMEFKDHKVDTDEDEKRKPLTNLGLSSEIGQSLKDVAKKTQWPATYAIPQSDSQNPDQDHEEREFTSRPGYVMQAFLLEESTSERRVMPSVVFLPMLQKQPAPLTITFTLTPA